MRPTCSSMNVTAADTKTTQAAAASSSSSGGGPKVPAVECKHTQKRQYKQQQSAVEKFQQLKDDATRSRQGRDKDGSVLFCTGIVTMPKEAYVGVIKGLERCDSSVLPAPFNISVKTAEISATRVS